ncbi:phytoene/squalene synthase family protein [Methylovirgula ligni]|uniref:Phytoene synthase n=1 Tax=Methylovirgula ligni TaxID=569860 RepID=A0A3D9Z4S3_9HYPH|nr:squalene/phytoene synthase family protein [Methylovirgula ligni]QAY96163.1 phytoene/squalene synthase family protein [Methylovirgula ligni]REF86149.1 phytoene synthase [Methylovirgula ligni]
MDHAADYAFCDQLLRREDKDRWLACLFLPAALRPHVVALYAFSHEIASVRQRVSESLLGEIRFQYWRDILTGERGADEAPIASALLDTVERFGLPGQKLISLIDARLFDLYDEPMPSVAALEAYAKATAGSLFQLAATILDPQAEAAGAAAHAGLAYAITGLLRGLPWQVAAGQTYVPRELYPASDLRADGPALDAALTRLRALARQNLAALAAEPVTCAGQAAPAFLPAALCELYLRQMEKPGYDPLTTLVEVPQWRRQWRLWRAAGRIG